MVFNSVAFIYYFLPLVIAVYFLFRRYPAAQRIWLLVASFFFYGWCNTSYLAFLLVYGLVNYCLGRLLYQYRSRQTTAKYGILIPAVAGNVLCLFVVKYLNFSIRVANSVLHTDYALFTNIIVPLGISFLVFSMISYLTDIYWNRTEPLKNLLDFFLYLSFFPKVSQGPITRYEEMHTGSGGVCVVFSDFCAGFRRFCFGLAKKVLIADILGASVDLVFGAVSDGIPTSAAWLGMLCYTFQIYFDFSGYTDMAIGLARMLGYNLPENFNAPYHSKSVSEFWRRWHITLGSWFREYIYIPLGGNRKGSLRTYCNMAVVWLLTGVWHGASYTYIMWGVCLGAIIIFERMIRDKQWYIRIPASIKWLITFVAIMFSWVLFRSDGIRNAARYFLTLFGAGAASGFKLAYFMDSGAWIALVAAIIFCLPVPERWRRWVQESDCGVLIQNIAAALLLAISLVFMVNSTYNAFIYFQF